MHAMASQRSLVCLLVLCLICCGASATAKRPYYTVSMDRLLSSKAHVDCPPLKKSVTASGNKLTIPAVCGLPGPPPKCCGAFERQILNHDMNRLRTLLRRSSVSSAAAAPAPSIPPFFPAPAPVAPPAEAPAVKIPDSSGSTLHTLQFVITVGFGTPVQSNTLMFDTGSDVSWIQCQPCSGQCYKQHDPVFDPTKSATYSAVPCGHPQCAAAGGNCSSNGTCFYEVKYGDGTSTAGVLSHDTLSLTSNRSLPGFAFGCGQTNLGGFGEVDGVIGLGRGALSLSSQAAPTFGGNFTYCLPTFDDEQGYLTIGSTAPASLNVHYTAMIKKKDYPSFYFVELASINIGGYVVPVPPSVFKDGTLIDSGITLMYIPPEAYVLLRDRFVLTMTQYKPAPAYEPFDTCYDFTGVSELWLPWVSFNFTDGSEFAGPAGILIYPDDTAPAKGCFAFAPRPSAMPFNVIGNTQQRGNEVIYDVAAGKIGFGWGSC